MIDHRIQERHHAHNPRVALRRTALLLCLIYIVATAALCLYVAAYITHAHDENGVNRACAGCSRLSEAVSQFKQALVAVFGIMALSGLLSACRKLHSAQRGMCHNTPISLKVRMNN